MHFASRTECDQIERERQQKLSTRPIVCIQGLGFVGAAMAAAVAAARDVSGEPIFDVVGVDLQIPRGKRAIEAINSGKFPYETEDADLEAAIGRGRETGNLLATSDPAVYAEAAVIVVDVQLDVAGSLEDPSIEFSVLKRAIATIGAHARPGCLVIVETTVPPGTGERVVAPELAAALAARGLPPTAVMLAHSYERVMPGPNYLASITDYWRVYAGHTPEAADACAAFLSRIVDTRSYPLTRLSSMTASETAKVLENTYRAVTIALMEEWGRFAENVGVDMHEIVRAIRMRPTHSNIRTPGFGVGGYCLTKDPLLAKAASKALFDQEAPFPFSTAAVAANRQMPLVSIGHLEARLGGLEGRTLLLLGVSYRPGVADTRYSPSEIFVRAAAERGAKVVCHDPLVGFWEEMNVEVGKALPAVDGFDAVVFAVAHEEYRGLDLPRWLGASRPFVFDANDVLTSAQREELARRGVPFASIGRG